MYMKIFVVDNKKDTFCQLMKLLLGKATDRAILPDLYVLSEYLKLMKTPIHVQNH